MTAASAWATFYEGRTGNEYLAYVKNRYAPFIRAIKSRLRWGDMVLELGAGTGTISKSIADMDMGVRVVATDVDPAMVDITRARLAQDDVTVFKMDARSSYLAKGDVVHSHGMLEHFDDETIRQVIEAHSHARVQVHYVPGLYEYPTYGDERLMSVDAWWKIAEPDEIVTFNDGLDYALIFER